MWKGPVPLAAGMFGLGQCRRTEAILVYVLYTKSFFFAFRAYMLRV